MINKISIFFILLISSLPITLISGPAIPDLTITFAGLFFLFLLFFKNEYYYIYKEKIFIISIIFWLYLLLVSIFAENIYLSLRDGLIFIRILFIPILILYWVSLKNSNLERIVILIFVLTIFVTLDTLYQFTQYNANIGFGKDLLGFVPNWYGRLTGPFGDELIPGSYLSRFSLLGLIFLLIKFKKNIYKYIFSISYLSLIGLVIFLTGERMALATFLMAIFFLFLFYKNQRLIFLFSLFFCVFFIFLTTKFHPFYNDYKIIESTPFHLGLKVEKKFKCIDNSSKDCKKIIKMQPEFIQVIKNFNVSAYGEIYSLGIKMFKDNKMLGVGLNNFTYLCNNDNRYNKTIINYACVSHPHNIYLQWLAETGLIGLIFFIIYLIYIFYFILIKKYNNFSLIGCATILILFWPIMSTGSLLKNWNGITTFFLIGISISLYKLDKKIN